MEKPMGYRNYLAVQRIASESRLSVNRKGVPSFDPMQYALLAEMAWSTADWPLDAAARKRMLLPRAYTRGWMHVAEGLGMLNPQTPEEVVSIGGQPRVPNRERLAANRISQTAGKLEKAGLLKCLRPGSVQHKENAVWLLLLGDAEENLKVEGYVRDMLRI